MKIIKRDKLKDLLNSFAKNAQTLAPVKENDTIKFLPWKGQGEIDLSQNALLPPKDLLFPQTEVMYRYTDGGVQGEITDVAAAAERQVIFGIRPCDVRSLTMMDDVFMTKGYEDDYYKSKRENTILISLGCNEPQPTCFCTSMGIDMMEADGADIVMYDLGEKLALEPKTDAGEQLLNDVDVLEDGAAEKPVAKECQLKADAEGLAEKLAQMFHHSYWEDLSRTCIGCGTCTYLCPTCHCFDIRRKNIGEEGFQFRCWDSCMFSEYTRMAGGHNPRPSKKERVRNRFLHKLQYFPERYGKVACVGCGRCVGKCPVNIDITRIIGELREVSVDE
ncbi:4Fe-4S dicluster domain-containing protein [Metallumcola ferriviriculae]|uniref:4Fe-4S dicluster domain-containing protein n=1 Tax=Metallumcola ferriviriculae TaxID=3039180 RepID=A0AAU0UP04_9FIRM|nr:4Fe-4S dicluster domain-containing protein [Desulfitibacteraceae bacterium MK1]